jgi:uncharacterized membrane protein YcaP (DUF421 family)
MDGQIKTHNLKTLKLDKQWLLSELKKFGINTTNDVLLASLDTQGKLYIQKKVSSKNQSPVL